MVPYGNRQNEGTARQYPYKLSEGKYAIMYNLCSPSGGPTNGDTNKKYGGSFAWYRASNKITILNNLYVYSYNDSWFGLLGQNSQWFIGYFDDRCGVNGYALQYQDNYEDKPEIRCYMYYGQTPYNRYNEYYSKNGDATCNIIDWWNGRSSQRTQNHIATYKTTTNGQYYGMWPVMNI